MPIKGSSFKIDPWHLQGQLLAALLSWNVGINVFQILEGFDLVLVNEALNSCVNIFNLYSGFLAYFTPKLAY